MAMIKHSTVVQRVQWRRHFKFFKLLSYCFEEIIGFGSKASFASCRLSRLIRWYNKRILRKGYSVPRVSWIKNYRLKTRYRKFCKRLSIYVLFIRCVQQKQFCLKIQSNCFVFPNVLAETTNFKGWENGNLLTIPQAIFSRDWVLGD